ncbi:MAG: hypothetical protein J6C84_01750 [Lachnospiraceae bacterium]|nr:hypothetical protein [Lachnospiraceae bacterium]
MPRKKNGFFTFIFSFLPGAGEMYMGFMKQGTSLMGAFFLLVFLAGWLNMEQILFVLPVLWCYGFFHVHNLRAMPDEEFYALEDDYLFHLDQVLPESKKLTQKYRYVLAIILLIIGVTLLLNNLGNLVRWCLPESVWIYYRSFVNILPQFVISILFIWGGIWLICGKKQELDAKEAEEKKVTEIAKEDIREDASGKAGEEV